MRAVAGHRYPAWGLVRRQAAEQSLHFVLKAGGKVDRVGITGTSVVAGNQLPQVGDHDWMPTSVGQLSGEFVIMLQVERINGAIPEVADEKITGECAEARWRNGEPPG